MLSLVALVLVICGVAWAVLSPGPGSSSPGAKPATVILARGEGLWGIGQDLAREGVVRSGAIFAAAAELSGTASHLKAGEYAFPPRVTLFQVLRTLRLGLVVRHFVTVPEGLTSQAVAGILDRMQVLTGPAPVAPEGALLPETYEVRRGETRAEVTRRMERARDALLARLWAGRPEGLPYHSPEDAVILASVVEKETALASERPRVAAVFINRLETGMRLESDPTVIYGLTGGLPLGHGLTRSELKSATPYNTYRLRGLPPRPIDNPGRAALTAALAPENTQDIYFVADGTGGHAFSPTLAQHLRNVAHWRLIEHAAKVPMKR